MGGANRGRDLDGGSYLRSGHHGYANQRSGLAVEKCYSAPDGVGLYVAIKNFVIAFTFEHRPERKQRKWEPHAVGPAHPRID
jgi:hypothetical protein